MMWSIELSSSDFKLSITFFSFCGLWSMKSKEMNSLAHQSLS